MRANFAIEDELISAFSGYPRSKIRGMPPVVGKFS